MNLTKQQKENIREAGWLATPDGAAFELQPAALDAILLAYEDTLLEGKQPGPEYVPSYEQVSEFKGLGDYDMAAEEAARVRDGFADTILHNVMRDPKLMVNPEYEGTSIKTGIIAKWVYEMADDMMEARAAKKEVQPS